MVKELKTKANSGDVKDYLNSIEEPEKRAGCFQLLKLMEEITGEKAILWGTSIVGFGAYHYKYASGQEGDWPLTGFSARKQNISVYIMPGFDKYKDLMSRLGKHKTGKSCLYLKKLEDADMEILKEIISDSVALMKRKYPF
jgi:Domain of unknown function (DU1801)